MTVNAFLLLRFRRDWERCCTEFQTDQRRKQVTTKGASSPAPQWPMFKGACFAPSPGLKLRSLTLPSPKGRGKKRQRERRESANHYSPRRRGFRGRVRSCAGLTSFGFTVGEGCGGVAPCGHNQISMKSESR